VFDRVPPLGEVDRRTRGLNRTSPLARCRAVRPKAFGASKGVPIGEAMSLIAGVDGCKGGWLCLTLNTESRNIEAAVVESIAELDPQAKIIAVDIPIGLPDANRREADRQARKRLGEPRRRSVFPAPIRPALQAKCWEDACQITLAINGHSITRQAFAILPKIAEADQVVRSASHGHRIYEVHPEVSFAEWSGTPMEHRKKSPAGRADRQVLIRDYFGSDAFCSARAAVRGHLVASDDIADAFAALWTAERIEQGKAGRYPQMEATDSLGVPMQIWF
jgi:predicted RNase H-like nuclease